MKINYFNRIKITVLTICFVLFYAMSLIIVMQFSNYFNFVNVLIFLVSSVLICIPISLGKKYWYFNFFGKSVGVFFHSLHFFSSGKLLFKSYWLYFVLFLLKLKNIILCFSVSAIIFSFIYYIKNTYVVLDVYFLVLLCLFIVSLIVGIIMVLCLNMNYFLSPYLLAYDPNISVINSIKFSKRLINGKKFDIIKVYLAYSWMALLFFTIIGYILFLPRLEYAVVKKVNISFLK